jgi:hypothetical protein
MDFLIKIYEKISVFLKRFKSLSNDLYRYVFIKVYFLLVVFINLLLWVSAYLMYRNISQEISILHYNVDFGIDLIGNKNYFFIIPLLSLFFILLNKIILLILLKRDHFKFLAHFLLGFLLLINIFLVLSLFSLYLINF